MKKRKTAFPTFGFLLLMGAFLILNFSLSFPLNAAEGDGNAAEAAAEPAAEAVVEEPAEEGTAVEESAEEEPETIAEKAEDGAVVDGTAKGDGTENVEGADAADAAGEADADADASATEGEKETISVYDLLLKGGPLMYPIALMSFLVIAVGLERFWGLRSWAVLPRRLRHNVDVQISSKADPRAIYALCRRNRSALSRVIQAALFKVGRPMSEVHAAIENAKENEANRLYGRVRLLVLAAAVTPLIGLLGTVMGMIEAFMATASSVGVHKAEMLSQGIYLALVTTCAGLIVAIPAAILAHWYEGKIQRLFYRMDTQLVNFISYLETLEGKVHVTPAQFKSYVKSKSGK